MTLDVPSEYEDVIRKAVAAGTFADEKAALRRALQLFAEQQQLELEPVAAENDEAAGNAFDAFQALGVIGCMKEGPVDLATNPDHREGFGR